MEPHSWHARALQNHAASGDTLNTYDIVAVVPKTERVFEWMVSNGQYDIISFDLSARLPFYLKPPHCAQV